MTPGPMRAASLWPQALMAVTYWHLAFLVSGGAAEEPGARHCGAGAYQKAVVLIECSGGLGAANIVVASGQLVSVAELPNGTEAAAS